jgi:hypothetical protein
LSENGKCRNGRSPPRCRHLGVEPTDGVRVPLTSGGSDLCLPTPRMLTHRIKPTTRGMSAKGQKPT